MNIFQDISDCLNSGKASVLCIVTATEGSTPRKSGSKMLVFEDGSIKGTIGGGSIEKQCIDDAINIMHQDKILIKSYNLANELEMHCGGGMTVYLEAILPRPELIIFGAGHIGKVLSKMASISGFNVIVADNRDGIFETWPSDLAKTILGSFEETIKQIDFHANTYIVSCTYEHAYDSEVVALCMPKDYKYLGMIGSKRKVELAKKRLKEEFGFKTEDINKLDMPIGIPIACETPEDIAVSILAKLIDVKNTINESN